jgi:uncharacterized protein (DUF2141 family)
MKKLFMILPLLLSGYALFAQTGKVVVTVKGIQVTSGGKLMTGLFIKERFPIVGKELQGRENAISASEITVSFDDVPIGTYAIVSFQDIDKDKKLKANFVGYPQEPVGFSRDAKIKLGPPAFEDASFKVDTDKTVNLTITLR